MFLKKFIICFFLIGYFVPLIFSQKAVYIPAYLRDTTDVNGAQFTMSKTYQDSNFMIIWGNTVGIRETSLQLTNFCGRPLARITFHS